MSRGGRREGAGRPKGLHGVKTTELAEMLDSMDANPAKGLARLALKAEREGNDDLAVRAFSALMPFRWPKLKESAVDLGLSGSLADRLEQAQSRLTISVVSGIDRPPGDPIEADPVPPPSPVSPPPSSPETPPSQSSPSLATSPEPRPVPPSPEPPAPSVVAGKPIPEHLSWTRRRSEPDGPSAISDYDPWKI
jgi:hypothetical protein